MQFEQLRRRQVITLLGGAAATWPIAARAQQGERMRRIGVLMPYTADDTESQPRVGACLQALALSGWTIGRNVRVDTRWAGPDADAIRSHDGTAGANVKNIAAFRAGLMEAGFVEGQNVAIEFHWAKTSSIGCQR